MHDDNFLQNYFLTTHAIHSLKENNYLLSIDNSIRDVQLKYKLEDDPRKQGILLAEFNRLVNEKDEYIAKKERDREANQQLVSLILAIVLGIIIIVAISNYFT